MRVESRFGVRKIVAEEEEGDHDDECVAGEAGTKVEVGPWAGHWCAEDFHCVRRRRDGGHRKSS